LTPEEGGPIPVGFCDGQWTSVDGPNNTAIADTGTTLALVDDPTVKAIYTAIPGQNMIESTGLGYLPED